MHILNPLVLLLSAASLLVPTALAAAASSSDIAADKKFAKFNALLNTPKHEGGILQLTDSLYDDLTTGPRNYTAVVLLTALEPRIGCQLCREFGPEYELLAKSWAAEHAPTDGLIFSELDFANARTTFQKLQLTTAPVLYLFPPSVGPSADPAHIDTPLRFEFNKVQTKAEVVARFITMHTTHAPRVVRPFNWAKLGATAGAVIFALTALKLAFPVVKPMLYSRNLWAAVSLIAILLFTSGHMFNHIRRVPYVANNGRGGISYVAGGFSNQFGLETQIVAVIYAILSFATISLAMKTPRIEDPARQKAAIVIWNVVLLVAFSFLMNLFKQKNGSYPFFLPPLM
ncbi:hypothetical protein P167DRAFT_516630 [Morchella conica CCBAS932]|uniref:Uncharacterized protein n=1 Tax=Morchella conica CCBAS932 TaxID=1392247 RepID=A0A3N4L4X3_9PEZI|nr:hypothetical protein P167DRAFT_516630 [Morchella conica CCBAS932]